MEATKDNTIRELKANWKLDSRVKGRVAGGSRGWEENPGKG